MTRLRAAWKAIRGATVIVGADGFIVIHVATPSVQWRGLDRASVASEPAAA